MRLTVLTVEDSISIRQAIIEILSEEGIKVVEAKNGTEGLKALSDKMHLVLLDLNMPEMDGYQFLEKLQKDASYAKYKNIPVIILTTETDREAKEKAKKLGAYGWIHKPFDPQALKSTVLEHAHKP